MKRSWLLSGCSKVGSALALCSALAAAQQPPGGDAQPNVLVQSPDVVMKQCPTPGATTNAASQVGTVVGSGDWVELRRTRCNGPCPAYTVRLGGDGTVRWQGVQSVAVPGVASAQVDAAQVINLIQQLLDHSFIYLCGSYSRPVTDASTSITTTSVANQTVQVSDYAASAPAWLRDFDDSIDALADTHRWRHGNPATEIFSNLRLSQDALMSKPGRNLMMHAAATGDRGGIELLLRKRTPVDAEDASGWTALMYAAGAGPLDQIRQLLAAGGSAAHVSRTGETLLFAALAANDNQAARLRLLQQAGANVAATATDGTTALMIAASHYWQANTVRVLIELGADPSVRNLQGKTAFNLLEEAHAKAGAPPDGYDAAHALLQPKR